MKKRITRTNSINMKNLLTISLLFCSVVMMCIGCVTGSDYPFCRRVNGFVVKEEERYRYRESGIKPEWWQYIRTEENVTYVVRFNENETRYKLGTAVTNVLIIER